MDTVDIMLKMWCVDTVDRYTDILQRRTVDTVDIILQMWCVDTVCICTAEVVCTLSRYTAEVVVVCRYCRCCV